MSPSAWTRGHARAIFHSLHFLAWLEDVGAPVVNGHAAFQIEISKARQYALLARLGVRYPATRVRQRSARSSRARRRACSSRCS